MRRYEWSTCHGWVMRPTSRTNTRPGSGCSGMPSRPSSVRCPAWSCSTATLTCCLPATLPPRVQATASDLAGVTDRLRLVYAAGRPGSADLRDSGRPDAPFLCHSRRTRTLRRPDHPLPRLNSAARRRHPPYAWPRASSSHGHRRRRRGHRAAHRDRPVPSGCALRRDVPPGRSERLASNEHPRRTKPRRSPPVPNSPNAAGRTAPIRRHLPPPAGTRGIRN